MASANAAARRRMVGGTTARAMQACSVTAHAGRRVVRTTIGIEAVAMMETAVPAMISPPYAWTAVVEMVAMIITVNREVPCACMPYYGTEEIVGSRQEVVLPVKENAAQVAQTIAVVTAIDVRGGINT